MSIEVLAFDFDGIFTDGSALFFNGQEIRALYYRDLDAFYRMKQEYFTIVISKSSTCEDLVGKINPHYAVIGVNSKAVTLDRILNQDGYSWQETLYVGDGKSDVECLKRAEIGIVPSRNFYEAQEAADYVLMPYRECTIEAIERMLSGTLEEEEEMRSDEE